MKHQITHSGVNESAISEVDALINKFSAPLNKYIEQLFWWNKRVNLVSRDVSRETVMEHVRHSLFVSVTESYKEHSDVLDTGTGGGLPGIPLAICHPEKKFLLNDIVTKKTLAVKQMASKLGLNNVITKSGSVEKLKLDADTLVITKHAFKVDDLVGLLGKEPWSALIFLKGSEESEEELEKLEISVSAKITTLDSKLDKSFYTGKGILEIKKRQL